MDEYQIAALWLGFWALVIFLPSVVARARRNHTIRKNKIRSSK